MTQYGLLVNSEVITVNITYAMIKLGIIKAH